MLNRSMLKQLTLGRSIAIAIGISLVAVMLALMVFLDIDQQIFAALDWLDSLGIWALIWFVVIMAAVVVFVLPGVLFTTGAGFLFGLTAGTLAVIIGSTLGASVAFLIARHLFADRVRRCILANNQFKLISGELDSRGFRLVLLTRLIPFFPGKLSNYLFGLTQIPLPHFVAASLIGFIPYSLHNVYLGSIAANITTLGNRHSDWGPLHWAVYTLGFVAVIAAALFLNRLAKRVLENDRQDPSPRGQQ